MHRSFSVWLDLPQYIGVASCQRQPDLPVGGEEFRFDFLAVICLTSLATLFGGQNVVWKTVLKNSLQNVPSDEAFYHVR